jgi:hypothetical protein
MYKVVYGFIDAIEKRNYKVGDTFIVGPKTDDKRIRSLSGYANNLMRPLIEKVGDHESIVDEPQASDLDELTNAQLREIAQEKGLDVRVKATKSELIAMIKGE